MTEKEIYIAIEAMLVKFANIAENNVIRAYPGERISLPPNNNYIIMTLVNSTRIGTPSADWTENDYTVTQNKEAIMQLDFFGEQANIRANTIVDLSRSIVLCDYLEPRGIQPLYADDVTNNTGVSGEKKYLERRTIQLHLNYNTKATVEVETFTEANFNIFKTEL